MRAAKLVLNRPRQKGGVIFGVSARPRERENGAAASRQKGIFLPMGAFPFHARSFDRFPPTAMPATRPNRTLATTPPAEAARYRAPDRLPPELHEDLRDVMLEWHRAMQEHPPPGVRAAIAYAKASWGRPLSEFSLYAIGEAGDRWRLMESVADVPTQGLLKSMPIIKPILAGEWERAGETESALWRYVSKRGILLWSGSAERLTEARR
jgi:hypothetical protein